MAVPHVPPRSRRRLVIGVLAVCLAAARVVTTVLLVTADRDAREVADGVVEALVDDDPEAYESLLCGIVDDPAEATPAVVSTTPLTATLRGLRHYPGEGRPDGQQEHYRATVVMEHVKGDLVLLIDEEEDGSWCLLRSFWCPETIVDKYDSMTTVFCSGRPERIES